MSQYKVGYKKPPLHSRFVKGKSGNPKGRPKKSILTMMDILHDELSRKITIKDADKISKVSFDVAIMRQLIHKAVKGDMRAVKYLLDMYRSFEGLEELIETPVMIINPPEGPRPYPPPPIYGEGEEG
jgi:hypothetical protein